MKETVNAKRGSIEEWVRVKTIFNAMGLNSGGVGSSAEVGLTAYFRSTVRCARLVISQFDVAFPPIVHTVLDAVPPNKGEDGSKWKP